MGSTLLRIISPWQNTLHAEQKQPADDGVSHVEDLRANKSDMLHQMTPDSFQQYFLHEGFGDLDDEDESDDDGDDDESDDEEDEEHDDAYEGPAGECEEDGEGNEEPDDENDY